MGQGNKANLHKQVGNSGRKIDFSSERRNMKNIWSVAMDGKFVFFFNRAFGSYLKYTGVGPLETSTRLLRE
ncbi:uncharacterized protein PHALS_05018 [Plasmopara halstedii]|uniref:Uncharacterized protein n=1 Tax=Plasmopara halstedii TaxID=4781 RepID=A0A0P1AAX8_PLAHL|nr:uncharacterized protein PHALS_05018 [Plasmopara halstedii]CEG37424.1 hypothetical protein PHALS_05018 [Plasmopara halstedii]|eukprot:XP_024573793.1 hypothetical protein PHALS_05018 [Plasmopara halstedii]